MDLAIPIVVVTLLGMNFKDMPELILPYGYPVTLGVTAVVCIRLFRGLKQFGWL